MGVRTYTITVQETGDAFECRGDESIFEAMRRARCGPVLYGCFGGGCGACRMRIVSGKYYLFKRQSAAHIGKADEKEKVVLLCCAQPRDDMVIASVNR